MLAPALQHAHSRCVCPLHPPRSMHVFCNHCIKKNLESRHRKCPGCGVGFGAGDVKHFYFT